MEEVGLPYEVLPVDTSKGEQHLPAFRKINPNGKVPAIVDTEGPGGNEARVFDSSAILLYLADKTGEFLGSPEDRPELVSWLFFIASGLGPFSGQSVHFQFAAPEGVNYARNRYRREAERHYIASWRPRSVNAPNAHHGCSGRWAAHLISAEGSATSTPTHRRRSNMRSINSLWRRRINSTFSTAASQKASIWRAAEDKLTAAASRLSVHLRSSNEGLRK